MNNILNIATRTYPFQQFTYNNKLSSPFNGEFQNQLLKIFKETIWNNRNTEMIKEEKSNNITKKIKNNTKTFYKKINQQKNKNDLNTSQIINQTLFTQTQKLLNLTNHLSFNQFNTPIISQLNYL